MRQLSLGFNIPFVIHASFAESYEFSEKDSMIYNDVGGLYSALINVLKLSANEYQEICKNLTENRKRVYEISKNNLQNKMRDYV